MGRRLAELHDIVSQHPGVYQERYWPSYLALAVAIVLQLRLPSAYALGPGWILPAIEILLLVVLAAARYLSPRRREAGTVVFLHVLTIGLIAIVSIDNLTALALLIRELLRGLAVDGRTLVLSALAIWLTNVIVFAMWFWEVDGGGPLRRISDPDRRRDFLFPQMQLAQDEAELLSGADEPAPPGERGHGPRYVGWRPDFVDYLYVSFTNATAFSPTDTMPLSHGAKALMTVQSAAALLTIALIAARAVNILQ
jgi:hypothetical protein